GAWVDSANCTVGGCTEDATQVGTTVCGLNDEGFFVQLCNATGTWDDTAACTGTDICVNGTTQNGTTVCNGTGVLVQDCTLGAWVDSANCTVGGCTEDATQVGSTACGLNLEGFYVQLCNAAGTWDDTAACTGTDVCVNNDTGTDNCGDGHGIQDLLCTGGAWVNDGSCVCTTGYYWDGATCAEAVTIDWCDVQAPKNYSGTVDATEVIYGQVYGLIGGTKVTGSGAFNPAIEAQLCYDDAGTETCMPAAFNPTCSSCGGDNDEYMAPLNFDTAGDYTYYYKFSGDMGNTWTTCDGTFLATITGGSTPTCDLSGYTLQQQNSAQTLVLPAGIVINAGEVLVIGRNTDEASFRTAWLIDSSVTFTYFNATSHGISINGDETFEISDAAMTSVDGPTSAITSGYNMQRTDTAAAAGDAASWIANSDEMTVATPGTFAGTVSGTGHAVITEYSDHTAFANEFVEIYCDK
ncbi:hypothetical protein KJ865_09815, partial [Myxococcota bacterium]|nr:hypothetical protein [Myxococcota bacterium]